MCALYVVNTYRQHVILRAYILYTCTLHSHTCTSYAVCTSCCRVGRDSSLRVFRSPITQLPTNHLGFLHHSDHFDWFPLRALSAYMYISAYVPVSIRARSTLVPSDQPTPSTSTQKIGCVVSRPRQEISKAKRLHTPRQRLFIDRCDPSRVNGREWENTSAAPGAGCQAIEEAFSSCVCMSPTVAGPSARTSTWKWP